MPEFRYRAMSADGEIVEGAIEARDRADAARQLHARDLRALQARAVDPGWQGTLAALLRTPLQLGRRPGGDEIAGLFRSLAALVGAGVSLDEALRLSAEGGGRLATAAGTLLQDLREGRTLSTALAAQGDLFPALATPLVAVGERTGELAAALTAVADHEDRARRLRDSLRGALAYPAFVAGFSFLVLVFVLAAVMPQIAELFENASAPPPWPARLALAASEAAGGYGLLVLALLLAAALAGLRALQADPGRRRRFDAWKLGLPLAGGLLARLETERFARLAAIMLRGGVDAPQMLLLASEAGGNAAVRADLEAACERLRQGHGLADALAACAWLSPATRELIAGGERASRLADTFEALARQQGEALDGAVRRLAQWLGPLAILLTGVLVGGLILSVMTALLGVNQLAL